MMLAWRVVLPISGGSTDIVNDLPAGAVIKVGLLPVLVAADAVGVAVDCVDMEGNMSAICYSGAYTDGAYLFSVTECATSSGTYTAVTTLDGVFTAFAAANQLQVRKFKRSKRFVQLAVTETVAGSTGSVLSAVLIGQKKSS